MRVPVLISLCVVLAFALVSCSDGAKVKGPMSFVSVSEALHVKPSSSSSFESAPSFDSDAVVAPALNEIDAHLAQLKEKIDELNDQAGMSESTNDQSVMQHPSNVAHTVSRMESTLSKFLNGEIKDIPHNVITDVSRNALVESGSSSLSKATAFLAGTPQRGRGYSAGGADQKDNKVHSPSTSSSSQSGYSAPAANSKTPSTPIFEFHKRRNAPSSLRPYVPENVGRQASRARFMSKSHVGAANSAALANHLDSYRRARGSSHLRTGAGATNWVLNRLDALGGDSAEEGPNRLGNNGYSMPSNKEPSSESAGAPGSPSENAGAGDAPNTHSMLQVDHSVNEPKPGASAIPGGGSPFTVNGNFNYPNVPGNPLVPSSMPPVAAGFPFGAPVAPMMTYASPYASPYAAAPMYAPWFPAAMPATTPMAVPTAPMMVSPFAAVTNAQNAAIASQTAQLSRLNAQRDQLLALNHAQSIQRSQFALQQQMAAQQMASQRAAANSQAALYADHTSQLIANRNIVGIGGGYY